MKIAQICSTFPPYQGGMGNVCYNISKQLAKNGHSVTVFTPKISKKIVINGNENFRVVYLNSIFSIGNAGVIPSLFSALRGFDIIHLHYPFFGGDWFVYIASKYFKIPYIITYHQDVAGNNLLKKLIFKIYNFIFQRSVINGSSHILALSLDHIISSQIRQVVNMPNKVIVVPNGIDPSSFQGAPKNNIRKKYGIKEDRLVICFVGALDTAHYFKRLDILIKAFMPWAEISRLVVIGDGDLRPFFAAMVQEMKLEDDVIFVGRLPNQETIDYVKQVDMLILPSTDTESFGIVLLEAMACGKPVIASSLPGVRVLVRDGYNGLLFQVGDIHNLSEKIGNLLKNKELRETLGANGKDDVFKHYSWEKITLQIEGIYGSIIQK